MKVDEIVKESFKNICKYYKKDFNTIILAYKNHRNFDTPNNRKK